MSGIVLFALFFVVRLRSMACMLGVVVAGALALCLCLNGRLGSSIRLSLRLLSEIAVPRCCLVIPSDLLSRLAACFVFGGCLIYGLFA